jgi:deferrochelatase/peroxidase EfeB
VSGSSGARQDDGPTRRGLVRAAASLAAAAGTVFAGHGQAVADEESGIEPFRGLHQAGITTPAQRHTYAAAFDLTAPGRDTLVAMLRAWTDAAARLCAGEPAQHLAQDAAVRAGDSGEALGPSPSRLTVTFGFGAGLFVKDGTDRYGLAAHRPPALVDLPEFEGDELIQEMTGGDISLQACADDALVAFHAVRQLARLARGTAELRWAQSGFRPGAGDGRHPRNLMGFIDGTGNPPVDDPAAMARFVWVGDEGPEWMRGGSYVVFRRIRVALEHWDGMPLDFQEQAFGRRKHSGAPLGGEHELDPPDLTARDTDGEPVIPESAHIRLAAAAINDGARILRRGYSYNDGVNLVTERWEPWRRRLEYDAGLFFVCYQRDPRSGFIRIFERLAKFDMLNQFVTHTGGGLFACPAGLARSEFIGQRLLES